jgi:hypothetical protein
MRDFRDAKAMARSLRHGLTEHGLDLSHGQCLDLTAKSFGFDNWNILAARIEAAQPVPMQAPPEPDKTLYCSFCGKSSHEVRALIAGPSAHICNECVGLCDDIVEHQNVLRLLKADEARNDDAGDYPSLSAYLAGRSDEQLRAYVAGVETDLGRRREHARMAAEAIAARAAGQAGRQGRRDKDGRTLRVNGKTDEELAKQEALFHSEIAQGLRAIEIVRRVLDARQ